MVVEELPLSGLLLIEPEVHEDERGFFLERYKLDDFKNSLIEVDFVQDNHSFSTKHVLRGLHYQKPPLDQDKLVWVTRGEVFDVVVDLRVNSASFGQWMATTLSEENRRMLLIPKGFAHGFLVLSEGADLLYKVSNYYSQYHECGLLWNDPDVGIEWPIKVPFLSEKDRKHPRLTEVEDLFKDSYWEVPNAISNRDASTLEDL